MRAMRRLGKGVMHSWVCSKLRIQVPAILACRALDEITLFRAAGEHRNYKCSGSMVYC